MKASIVALYRPGLHLLSNIPVDMANGALVLFNDRDNWEHTEPDCSVASQDEMTATHSVYFVPVGSQHNSVVDFHVATSASEWEPCCYSTGPY